MEKWHKTGCVLCAQNCGIEVLVRDNKMVKVQPMKENLKSKGYICRKGLNVANHQHHADRLTHPLKREGGVFVKISWEQAIREISEKLRSIIDKYGPRSFAYMGGGGQGCHFDALFGHQFMRVLGSKYHYNPLAQELTGYFWVCGRALGRQNRFAFPDEARSDMLLAVGWNGMVSHQMARAPLVLKEFARDPNKLLVSIDPRKSETAQIANIHLAIRPGTDALMTRAMIALILEKGWENTEYIHKHVSGWDEVRQWFENFDTRKAIEVCGLEFSAVEELCRLLTTRKWCMHPDLGILMNRHSTVTSYLQIILMAVCGRLCVPGGNVIPGCMIPLGFHTDERDPRNWRTVATDFPAISGFYPPNVLPEEILSDHPERVRAVVTSASNPLRSFSDTTAYEKAFKKLDLLVVIELAMTETAEMADYVLPARSGYESWDGTFFPFSFPEIYFQMRRPIIEPEGEPLECGEIFTRLANGMGLFPPIPESLYRAAAKGSLDYGIELAHYMQDNPQAIRAVPFVVVKTLGKQLGSAHLALLQNLLQTSFLNFKAADGELLETDELFLRMADGEWMFPPIPAELVDAAQIGAGEYLKELSSQIMKSPKSILSLPITAAYSLGLKTVSKHLMTMWALSRVRPSRFMEETDRQGFTVKQAVAKTFSWERLSKVLKGALIHLSYLPFINLTPTSAHSDTLFEAIVKHDEGLWVGRSDMDNMKELRTRDGKINAHIPELAEWVKSITPESEEKELAHNPEYPLLLVAGRHMKMNANTLMRNPDWNKKLRACTLLMNPQDAGTLGIEDGRQARVVTEAGSETIEIEVTDSARVGQVVMPHGFGLKYNGVTFGANVNRLTKATNRDKLAGTPLHRYVRCRVEPI